MKRLSICMIVKDEEQLLPRCLESVKGLADEIIVVDTGSTDRSKQIALEYGARCYDYSWSNDFSAARNESLQYATGTWVLVLDADEYIAKDEYSAWVDFLDTEEIIEHLAYTISVVNFTGETAGSDEVSIAPVTRLFPNYKGIHFERPIHEQLSRGATGTLSHKKVPLNIYHTGYQLQRVHEKNKHERNMNIFDSIKKNSTLTEYDWFTLGNQHRFANEVEEAILCYEKALHSAIENTVWYPHCLVSLITLYFKNHKWKQAWELIEGKLSAYDKYAEYYTFKGIQLMAMGFLDPALSCLLEAIEIGEKRSKSGKDFWLVDPTYSFETPAQQLVELYFKLNNNQQAIYWLSKLLQKNNRNAAVLHRLTEWLLQNESAESVMSFLDSMYDLDNREERQLLYKVSLVLGKSDLATHYISACGESGSLSSSSTDCLRLIAMGVEQEEWDEFQIPDDQSDLKLDAQLLVWTLTTVASIHWKDSGKLEHLSKRWNQEQFTELTAMIVKYVRQEESSAQDKLSKHASSLFLVAKQLFLLKRFDEFDDFIQHMQSPELINHMSNYFYQMNHRRLSHYRHHLKTHHLNCHQNQGDH